MEPLQDLGRGIMSVYWPDTTGQRRKHQRQLPAKPQNKEGDVGRRGSWKGAAAQMKSEGLMWKHLNETKSLFTQGCLCGVHNRRKLGCSDTESRQMRGLSASRPVIISELTCHNQTTPNTSKTRGPFISTSLLSLCLVCSNVLRHPGLAASRPNLLFRDLPHSQPLISTRAAYLRCKAIISSRSPINILESTQHLRTLPDFKPISGVSHLLPSL